MKIKSHFTFLSFFLFLFVALITPNDGSSQTRKGLGCFHSVQIFDPQMIETILNELMIIETKVDYLELFDLNEDGRIGDGDYMKIYPSEHGIYFEPMLLSDNLKANFNGNLNGNEYQSDVSNKELSINLIDLNEKSSTNLLHYLISIMSRIYGGNNYKLFIERTPQKYRFKWVGVDIDSINHYAVSELPIYEPEVIRVYFENLRERFSTELMIMHYLRNDTLFVGSPDLRDKEGK
ncbi:hypothetical protein JW964_08290 [candidate division KSB1 bacterium]|nr:hypothetical protein [candidate division KSB1 bacterium]